MNAMTTIALTLTACLLLGTGPAAAEDPTFHVVPPTTSSDGCNVVYFSGEPPSPRVDENCIPPDNNSP